MARGKDESHNPKRRPTYGYSPADSNDAPEEPSSEPKKQEDIESLLDRLDKLAGYGKVRKKYGYPEKPMDDWGLDWPED